MSTSNNKIVTKLDAIKWLSKRPVINTAGTHIVTVKGCNKVNIDGRPDTDAIINFDVMNEYQAGEAKRLLIAGEYNDAANQGLSLSCRKQDFQPSAGEIVKIIVKTIINKDGDEALLVTKCVEIVAKEATTVMDFSFEDELVDADTTSMD